MSWFRRTSPTAPDRLPPLPPIAPAAPVAAAPASARRDPVGEAEAAERVGDWAGAAAAYRLLVEARPDASSWVRLATVLAKGGATAEAEHAYAAAVALAPRDASAWHERGRLLIELDRRDEAVRAFAAALAIDPQRAASRRALLFLGARDTLPVPGEATARLAEARAFDATVARGFDALQDWAAAAGYPLSAYDRFRRDFPVRPPPGPLPQPADGELTIVVDALAASPSRLRTTLRSLADQSVRRWRAMVLASTELRAHPVASLATADERIAVVAAEELDRVSPGRWVASVSAGTALHPEALAWLLAALARTGGVAATCDHDRATGHWTGVADHHSPAIGAFLDPDLLRQSDDPPALVLAESVCFAAAAAELAAPPATWGAEWRRAALLIARERGGVPHVPRLLATIVDLPLTARDGRAGEDDDRPGYLSTPPAPPPAPADPALVLAVQGSGVDRRQVLAAVPRRPDDRLLAIVPTRDEPELLGACLASLRRRAARPELLDIVVIDNRSTASETRALLADEARLGTRVLTLDEPFNWSRTNNLAAAAGDQPHVLFLNNDVAVLTQGWDQLLAGSLQRPDVGAVGARLLYPTGRVQHAGILMGVARGLSVHDGRDAAPDDGGPGERWHRTRRVAALTGAFLGVRRELFRELGGFDEALAVGYNDIDFCLKVRERGLACQYLPAIEAVHHESRTRGLNDVKAKVAWDQGELADLHARWGRSLIEDPGYSPMYALGGKPFDGYREPTMTEILRHIDLTGGPDPWRPVRRDVEEAGAWAPGTLL